MSDCIREESGILLAKKQGFYLFDIETLVSNHPSSNWKKLKVPEFILWNEKEIVIVEAKSSIPKDTQSNLESHIKKHISDCGYKLISKLDSYCEDLREKYTTALIILRPDIIGEFLDDVLLEDIQLIDSPDLLRKSRPNKAKIVRLLWLLKNLPDEMVPVCKDTFNSKILPKLKCWQKNCEIVVMNEKMAVEYGYAIRR